MAEFKLEMDDSHVSVLKADFHKILIAYIKYVKANTGTTFPAILDSHVAIGLDEYNLTLLRGCIEEVERG